MWELNELFRCSTAFFILITMTIAIKILAYIFMIQSWKWFLESHDHFLNCFCFSGFYDDISFVLS